MLHDSCGEITIMKSTTAPLILACVSSMTMRTADVSAGWTPSLQVRPSWGINCNFLNHGPEQTVNFLSVICASLCEGYYRTRVLFKSKFCC